MKVLWSPEARQDLREIYLYLAAEDPDAARALHKRIKQGVQLLRDNSHIGRHGRVPGTRELVIVGTYYIVPYRIRAKRLELLRVYHTACKWPEHFHQGGQQMHRWIQTEKARYYQALLVNDLFGEWTLVMAWGALGSKRGGMRSTRVPSYEAGLEWIWEIEKRRKRHGYRSLRPA